VSLDLFPKVQLTPELEPDERFTPRSVFAPLATEFGFTLDACATAESAKCERYFAKAEDSLSQSWLGERCWVNPPYSDIQPWVRKAWSAEADLVVMLVPAWTDRDWWAEFVEPYRDGRHRRAGNPRYPSAVQTLETRFLRGRIRFGFPGNPEGVRAGSPPFWCCLLIWRVA
jgi:phage N-6-adenine-methyltransferase